jgi:hypothetical protein
MLRIAERFRILMPLLFCAVGLLVLFLGGCDSFESKGSVTEVSAGLAVVDFGGDWEGVWRFEGEEGLALCAQVISNGVGKYKVNLLGEFDKRIRPMVVMDGVVKDGRLECWGREEFGLWAQSSWQGFVEGDVFSGTFSGRGSRGEFTLKKISRVYDGVGAKAPAGAVVLFDGSGFEVWHHIGGAAGFLNFEKLIPCEYCAAYARCEVWSDDECKATLHLGSDDGVKVWLNGKELYKREFERRVKRRDDKVRITLKKGWNELLVKVANTTGRWGMCARIVDAKAQMLSTIAEKDKYGGGRDKDGLTRKYLDGNGDYLSVWEFSGPYKGAGKDVKDILAEVFAPEEGGGKWRLIKRKEIESDAVGWKLLDDGSMVIEPGNGDLVSREVFGDCAIHVEFATPEAEGEFGQFRGNSGVYIGGMYEVQILDSYGGEGLDNQCGGIYKVARPIVHMCAAAGEWQSYDIEFTSPRFDAGGKKTANAKVTVVHNGVLIQDGVELPDPTGSAIGSDEAKPCGLMLQDHRDKVRFRNIWVEKL